MDERFKKWKNVKEEIAKKTFAELTSEDFEYLASLQSSPLKQLKPEVAKKILPKGPPFAKNDKLKCDICGKKYTRKNAYQHKKTKWHQAHEEMNQKVMGMLRPQRLDCLPDGKEKAVKKMPSRRASARHEDDTSSSSSDTSSESEDTDSESDINELPVVQP